MNEIIDLLKPDLKKKINNEGFIFNKIPYIIFKKITLS